MLIEAWKPIWAGGQVHVWELCNKLVEKHNCEVDLFVMNFGDEKRKELPQHESHLNGRLNIFRVGGECSPESYLARIKWCWKVYHLIKKKHTQRKYDLIHAHANLPGLPGKLLGRKLKIPVVFTVHGCGLEAIKDMYGSGIKSYILYQLERFLQTKLRYDYQITVDSSFLKRKNVNQNIVVIPNGVDVWAFDKVKVKKCDKFKIIFVGRLHPQKGLMYLLDALKLLKETKEDSLSKVEVHIIGSGPLERELNLKSERLGLENTIKFRGKIYGEELIKEYKSSHLFVLPSLYEGQPLTLLEAWAVKLPVIVTDVGGNRDFVVEGENGYLIPAKDVEKLAQSILVAVNNAQLGEMGERGYQLVKEHYTWDKTAEKTYGVYGAVGKR